jgi:hypothetical protein
MHILRLKSPWIGVHVTSIATGGIDAVSHRRSFATG